ncbi:glycosyltransferase [Devriesea agamarum]|uniref:glycosyltransferase n=1 Tax=Devriesea agamarum TaxID=472569 RepID=UPI000A075D6D|nr:glycosyltransferase [Devriesea agamarum]
MTTSELPQRSCAAVVTAFRPTDSLRAAIDSLRPQVQRIVIVDDGSPDEAARALLESLRDDQVEVIHHPENLGIGQALNTGLAALDSAPPEFVLTMDQDSVVPDRYVTDLLRAFFAASAHGVRVGMIAPGSAESVHRADAPGADNPGFRISGEPIQSGLLIPWSVFAAIGRFRADLFIDSVDSEFYLRAHAAGFQCIAAPGVRLRHRLGTGYPVSIAGRHLELTVASDFRYYYQVRNLIHLTRSHARTAPLWTAAALGREVRHLAIVTACVPGRTRRLREAVRGLGDGLRGRTGRRPEPRDSIRARIGDTAANHSESADISGPNGLNPPVRISVCMAAWNGEKYIGEQLTSILDQLGPNDEVIVVDDCSSDHTADVVDSIDDSRIRLIRAERNAGYVKTFERAMKLAQGEYVLLSDQDDVWLPGRAELMVAALSRRDVVATNLTTLGGPDAIPGPYGQSDWHLRAADSTRHLRNILGILAGNRPYYGCAMGVHRRALERGALPFPAWLTESHDLWLALYANVFGSLTHCEERSLARRYHDSNQTQPTPRGLKQVIRSRLMLMRALCTLFARKLRRR